MSIQKMALKMANKFISDKTLHDLENYAGASAKDAGMDGILIVPVMAKDENKNPVLDQEGRPKYRMVVVMLPNTTIETSELTNGKETMETREFLSALSAQVAKSESFDPAKHKKMMAAYLKDLLALLKS